MGCAGSTGLVLKQRERVHHVGVAEQVDRLPAGADGVGPPREEGVVETAVDGFGVVAAAEEVGEHRIGRGDGPEVLGPVELPLGVFVVAVEADGDGAAAEVLGQGVLVVPAVGAGFVSPADGVGAAELFELEPSVFGDESPAWRPTTTRSALWLSLTPSSAGAAGSSTRATLT